MKQRVFWLTGSSFYDVDEKIVPALNEHYDIFWFVLRQKESFYSKAEIEDNMVRNNINGIVADWAKLRSFKSFRDYFNLAQRIKKGNYDLVYIDFLGLPYMFPLFHLLRVRKDNLIYACHDFIEHINIKNRGFIGKYRHFVFNHFDNIQLFSRTQKELFNKQHDNFTYYAPLALKDFGKPSNSADSKSPDKVRFLFFGNIQDRKGLEYLIEAGNILSKKHSGKFVIDISGNSKDWERYASMIDPEAVKDFDLNIRRIENEEIPLLFTTSDYLVLPYKDVTQSGPLLISYNYTLPVIASDHPGFREYIENGVTGFLFKNMDSNDLARVMSEIIDGKHNYKEIKDNLSGFIDRNVALDKIVDKYIEGFDTVIKRSKK